MTPEYKKLKRKVHAAIRDNRRFPMAGDAAAVSVIMESVKEYVSCQQKTKKSES